MPRSNPWQRRNANAVASDEPGMECHRGLTNARREESHMTPEQLQTLHQNAESTLQELMDILNHTPLLTAITRGLLNGNGQR